MGGVNSRQIDMRAHGTQKTKTKPCTHTNQKHKHMASKTNHQPCAKQDTNTQLMRILISHMFTQDMTTWMHAADKNTNCVQHHKHMWDRRIRSWANSRLPTHTTRQNTERTEPRHETETQDRMLGSEHHAPTRNKAHRRESARLEHTRSRALTYKQDMTEVTEPWKIEYVTNKTLNPWKLL